MEMEGEDLKKVKQDRHYAMLNDMQDMSRDLPWSFQQRLPYTTLSNLASALLDGTVFEIVQYLEEIQHMQEKKLLDQRSKLINSVKAQKQEQAKLHQSQLLSCQNRPHHLPVVKATNEREKQALDERLQEEVQKFDEKIVLQLDQRANEQQVTLQQSGVLGFFPTTNPQEIRLQMYLLEFIIKLRNKYHLVT
ncbi:protein DGCR6L-like [Anneissia japonica]|uniref:protein DGCR6L-like n=1 Tax=Anneissia japonica TaxID=1529436 RepID=UPI0014254DEA|nr:protein DGCR6L-like [Anneissia japonica]